LLSVRKGEFPGIIINYPIALHKHETVNAVLYANGITEMETKRERSDTV